MAKLFILTCLVALSVAGLARANPPIKRENENNFCQGCRAFVSFSQTFNSSANRSEYKGLFKDFCEFYYPVSTDFQQGPCPFFVEALYTLLNHIDPIHHCDQIGACGSTQGVSYQLAPELSSMSPKQANVICKFCEQSVEQVQQLFSDPETIDRLHRQADQLCDFLKVVDADKECRQLMNRYLDQAIRFIQSIDPQTYCRSIQLCPAGAKSTTSAFGRPLAKKSGASRSRVLNAVSSSGSSNQQLPTLADFNDFGIETSVSIGTRSSVAKVGAPECTLCKTIVREMFHFVRENKTEVNIIKGLDRVCKVIFNHGENFDQCESMVKAYTKEIIQLMLDETDPEMICVLLEQCVPKQADGFRQPFVSRREPQARTAEEPTTSFLKPIDLGELIHRLDPTVKLRSAKACFECKMFIKYLKNTIEEPKSKEYIKNWLRENLCQRINSNETKEECDKLVQTYADTFFAAVIGSLNPSTACKDLGACNRTTLSQVLQIDNLAPLERSDELPSFVVSPKVVIEPQEEPITKKVAPQQQASKVKGQLCDQCVQIVTNIDEYLAQHPVDKDVSVLIDQVCNKLPEGSVRNECTYMIETFGSEIAQAVATMDNPRQVCQKLLLC